jgi:hypothetical protein
VAQILGEPQEAALRKRFERIKERLRALARTQGPYRAEGAAAGSRSRTRRARAICARCHSYCFGKGHLDMLGGDFVSVNLNCIDGFDVSKTELVHWDGRHDNWQAGPRPSPWPVAAAQA